MSTTESKDVQKACSHPNFHSAFGKEAMNMLAVAPWSAEPTPCRVAATPSSALKPSDAMMMVETHRNSVTNGHDGESPTGNDKDETSSLNGTSDSDRTTNAKSFNDLAYAERAGHASYHLSDEEHGNYGVSAGDRVNTVRAAREKPERTRCESSSASEGRCLE